MERNNERMRYTVEQGEKLAQKLRALPPIEKSQQDLSVLELIKMLWGEIQTLQKQGYSIERISEVLRAEGVNIAAPTLKNYIQKARSSSSEGTSKRRTKGTTKRKNRETSTVLESKRDVIAESEPTKATNTVPNVLSPSVTSPATSSMQETATRPARVDPEKATFTPRPDRQKL
jgi:alanyl-tRNA synthetase